MRYTTPGPVVESGVTHERIATYVTTRQACQCPANYYQPGICKHIAAARHGCGCPESLWMTKKGAHELICAEDRCEYSKILRQAMLNEGWTELPESLAYSLCFICKAEILPRAESEQDKLRYCYKGEHWVMPVCVKCGETATGANTEGEAICALHEGEAAEIAVAV